MLSGSNFSRSCGWPSSRRGCRSGHDICRELAEQGRITMRYCRRTLLLVLAMGPPLLRVACGEVCGVKGGKGAS
jgi:hypothetical protein